MATQRQNRNRTRVLTYHGTEGLPQFYKTWLRFNDAYFMETGTTDSATAPTMFLIFQGNGIWDPFNDCLPTPLKSATGAATRGYTRIGSGTTFPQEDHPVNNFKILQQAYSKFYVRASTIKYYVESRSNTTAGNSIMWVFPTVDEVPTAATYASQLQRIPNMKRRGYWSQTGFAPGQGLTYHCTTAQARGQPLPSADVTAWGDMWTGTSATQGKNPTARWFWIAGLTQVAGDSTNEAALVHIQITYEIIFARREAPIGTMTLISMADPNVFNPDEPTEVTDDDEEYATTPWPTP